MQQSEKDCIANSQLMTAPRKSSSIRYEFNLRYFSKERELRNQTKRQKALVARLNNHCDVSSFSEIDRNFAPFVSEAQVFR